MQAALQIVAILLAIALVVVILLQARTGGLGEMLGGDQSGITRTRRGLEKTLFNATIALAIAFVLVAILSAYLTT
jgi:preprotein translocase subunit SecG